MNAFALYLTLVVANIGTPPQAPVERPAMTTDATIYFDAPIHSVPTILR
jgi:hypothetical protein